MQGETPESSKPMLNIKAMRKAVLTGFALTDQQVLAQAEQRGWNDGAVCAAVWIVDETVVVANVGLQNYILGVYECIPARFCHTFMAPMFQQCKLPCC